MHTYPSEGGKVYRFYADYLQVQEDTDIIKYDYLAVVDAVCVHLIKHGYMVLRSDQPFYCQLTIIWDKVALCNTNLNIHKMLRENKKCEIIGDDRLQMVNIKKSEIL